MATFALIPFVVNPCAHVVRAVARGMVQRAAAIITIIKRIKYPEIPYRVVRTEKQKNRSFLVNHYVFGVSKIQTLSSTSCWNSFFLSNRTDGTPGGCICSVSFTWNIEKRPQGRSVWKNTREKTNCNVLNIWMDVAYCTTFTSYFLGRECHIVILIRIHLILIISYYNLAVWIDEQRNGYEGWFVRYNSHGTNCVIV